MPLKETLLVYLPNQPPPGWIAKATARFPGLEIRWKQAPMLTTGGLEPLDKVDPELLKGVTILAIVYPPADPAVIRDVRFVQMATAGSDYWNACPVFKDPAVEFCSGSGVHAPQISEWVVGAWLSHLRYLSHYAIVQREQASWKPVWDAKLMRTDSAGRRVGILGYGAIGRCCGRVLNALGMEVYAYTQSPRTTPESRRLTTTYMVPGTGDPEGTVPSRWFSGALDDFLAQDLDLLVVSLPLTEGTRGAIGRRQFEILAERSAATGRPGTYIANVARGPIIDTDALVDALQGDLISGAALDVTDPEPLPDGHPLWKAPNVLITPHISWQSTSVFERVIDVLYTNLERLDLDEPRVNAVQRKGLNAS